MESLDKFEGKKRQPDKDLAIEQVEKEENSKKSKNKKGKNKKERKNTRNSGEERGEQRVDNRGGNWYNGKFSEKEDLKSEKFEYYYKVRFKRLIY